MHVLLVSLCAAVDNMGPVNNDESLPTHRTAPASVDTHLSILETGIKVVDLLAPYRHGALGARLPLTAVAPL